MPKKQSKQEWSKREITFVLNKHQAGYSRNEIAKAFNLKFPDMSRTQDSIKHCVETHGQHIEQEIPKVLILDIETKPIQAWVWGIFDQNIPLNMVTQDGSILSWSAKWLGEPESKVMYKDMRGKEKNLSNDKELLLPLWKLMNEATIILGQNSDSFDIKKLNARFIQNGLDAPDEYKTIDTLKLARRYFGFMSNKLEHLSSILNKKHTKSTHKQFPGFSLWEQCIAGNLKAWKEMQSYNKLDVFATEEVFLKLSKYVKNNKTVTAALRAYNKNIK